MEPLQSEKRLVTRFKAGDVSAFEAIMKHYDPYVMGLALRMTGNRAAAEDVCQEVFLKVLKGLGRFKGGSGLKTWIFRICHNAVVDYVRSSKADGRPIEEISETVMEQAGEVASPIQTIEEGQLREEVQRAMSTLPPLPREVLHLYYWNQLSVNEIGKTMRLPEGTVKTHLFRGRKALRETISQSSGEMP